MLQDVALLKAQGITLKHVFDTRVAAAVLATFQPQSQHRPRLHALLRARLQGAPMGGVSLAQLLKAYGMEPGQQAPPSSGSRCVPCRWQLRPALTAGTCLDAWAGRCRWCCTCIHVSCLRVSVMHHAQCFVLANVADNDSMLTKTLATVPPGSNAALCQHHLAALQLASSSAAAAACICCRTRASQ
jgi:hypothetical protein